MRWGAEHVDVEKFGYIVMPREGILLTEGGADGGGLLLD